MDNVVAMKSADRDELDILHVEARQKFLELVANLDEALFAPVDEIHLVHRDDEVRDAEQRGDARVAAALFNDTQAGIQEDDREICRRSARDHVPRVLNMPGCVRDDEFATRRGKVPVGDVDGDALFALRAKTIGKICEIDLAAARNVRGALERFELILHQ
jgi:hypothetical protein